ncbi:MAG: hypothetical protein R3A51_19805 [Nannocystaceae bacterium]
MIKGGLARLLAELASSGEALAALTLRLELDLPRADREGREDEALQIEPAAPSRDLLALVDLVRLRLDELELPAPAQSLTLEATPAAPSRAQVDMHLEAGAPRRDPAAAAAALARLRAAYGDQAVTRARVRAAHLPEASFQWEPAAAPPRPQGIAWPRASWAANHGAAGHDGPPLLRRLLRRPLPLDPPPITDMEDFINMSEKTLREPWALPAEPGPGGAIRRLFGPHRVSGGWWARTVERDYYYAETSTGALLWIFHDRARGRWFWHGTVD